MKKHTRDNLILLLKVLVVITTIVGLIITYRYNTGYYLSADIRLVNNIYSNDPCPLVINFNEGNFIVSLSNVNGDREGDVKLWLSSSNITFIQNYQELNVPAKIDRPTGFRFSINTSSLLKEDKFIKYNYIADLKINILGEYVSNKKGEIKSIFYPCSYKRKDGTFILEK